MTDFLTELRGELLEGLERYERAPWWRRPVRIGPLARLSAAAAMVAAVVAALVISANRPADHEQTTTPPVSRLEGFHASGEVEADGSLWASEYNSASLLRIDLRTGKIAKRIDVGGGPGSVISAAGAIWVQDWEQGRLIKVDPGTNRIAGTLDLGESDGDIAFAGGSVWAMGEHGILERVDPETVAVTKRIPLRTDGTAPTLAVAGDTLWVTAGSDVIALDARAGETVGRTRGPFVPTEFARRAAADEGGLWISSPTRREVVHLDARTLRKTRYPVDGDASTVAIVDGRVWVATVHDGGPLTRVSVLDADGRVVGTIPLPHPAVGIVASPAGGAWVTFGEDSTVSPAAIHVSGP